MGFLSALAGLVYAARLRSASTTAGMNFELNAIGACFIGGASAYGGIGTVFGTVIGALIIAVLNNGMSILGVNMNLQSVIKGLVLLFAVAFDVITKMNIQVFKRKKITVAEAKG
jgi:putative multiple sugar transport system permease protein